MRIYRGLTTILTLGITMMSSGAVSAYQLDQRWTSTATNGGGLTQGTPTTIRWSIVPDGTIIPNQGFGSGPSNFIAQFDARFGAGPGGSDLTQRPWFTYFEQSFNRWGELGGLSYVYEPNDDGVQVTSGNIGSIGVRGDVRISGKLLDGASGVLAYNNFPNYGDMVIDTGDMNNYASAANNRRFLRNVVMHEHGHGMGLRHVESNNANFLMEPFINTSFDGPQLDDIRGMHRHYGDKYEKNGGNDTAATATDIGVFGDGSTFRVGFDGRTTFVTTLKTDFISIDDNSDIDYLSFTLSGNSLVSLTLEPVGSTYLQGPQGGSQTSVNTSQISDLTLQLIDSDQLSQLAISNVGGLGVTESINDFALNAGTYYARITGTANDIQMYEFNLSVTGVTVVTGDFDNNGIWDCADINALTAAVANGSTDLSFDMNGDGIISPADVTDATVGWLAVGGANSTATGGNPFLVGDADLNGVVDGTDFIAWNAAKFTSNTDWCAGNFNADSSVDGSDFIEWNANKFTSSAALLSASLSASVSQVPEPSSILLLACGLLWSLQRRRG